MNEEKILLSLSIADIESFISILSERVRHLSFCLDRSERSLSALHTELRDKDNLLNTLKDDKACLMRRISAMIDKED